MRRVPIPLTPRLATFVKRAFAGGDPAAVIAALEQVDLGDWLSTQPPLGRERVLAAILVMARGERERLGRAIDDAERDWRDALVWGGLGKPDWPERLDELLGAD